MSEEEIELVTLSTVPLTRQKQDIIDSELERYAAATNYLILNLFGLTPNEQKNAIHSLKEDFSERFDSRPEYFDDVLKTARFEITDHKRQAKYLRNLRGKTPHFEGNELRFSSPIVEIGKKAILLKTVEEDLPLPFDKYSRNKNAQILQEIRSGNARVDRVRFGWNKEGYFDVDIRLQN